MQQFKQSSDSDADLPESVNRAVSAEIHIPGVRSQVTASMESELSDEMYLEEQLRMDHGTQVLQNFSLWLCRVTVIHVPNFGNFSKPLAM